MNKKNLYAKLLLVIIVTTLGSSSLWSQKKKSLVDYFLPMEPQGEMISEEIWGDSNVLPRDVKNGLEDKTAKNWCYWDGGIVKDDKGLYHMYASKWDQKYSHSEGWHLGSKGMHAVSENVMGPYIDKGFIYPQWKESIGHNVMGLRMHDGRYAVVTSEITEGDVLVSDSPDGPFEWLGKIEVDPNGFDIGLARYQNKTKPSYGHMSNVKILLRPDGRYMLIGRSTAIMISDNGILGPYKIMNDRVYRKYPDLPQSRNEDPTIWYSGGIYHLVYNHWPTKTSHHYSSVDGITDWVYRGVAFSKEEIKIFKYTDGTINDWQFIERPAAHVENGHVTHFMFSVIDVGKGKDRGSDKHASKIVIVPFDGKSFDRDMQKIIESEKK